jgi:hypothetical protein
VELGRVLAGSAETAGINPLPADPVGAYLTERVEGGIAVTSLSVTACAINHVHRTHGLANPMAHQIVRQVRAGLRRTHGVPRRPHEPRCLQEQPERLRQSIDGRQLPMDERTAGRYLTDARQKVGGRAWRMAWQCGYDACLERAVELALDQSQTASAADPPDHCQRGGLQSDR